MTVLHATATTDSGCFYSAYGTSYASIRAGTSGVVQMLDESRIGQRAYDSTEFCFQTVIDFDTSSIPVGSTISAAVLSLYLSSRDDSVGFTIQVRANDHGSTTEIGDYVPGATFVAETLLASYPADDPGVGYFALTDVAMPAHVNAGGSTRMVLCSDRFAAATAPSGNEYVTVYSYDTTNPAKLDVTYTPPTPPASSLDPMGEMGFFGL